MGNQNGPGRRPRGNYSSARATESRSRGSPWDEMPCPRHLLPWNLTLTWSPNLPTELSLPSHLPFHFLCNLLNSQLIVLSQELQLLVDESQPILPLFPHLQTVNSGSKRALLRSLCPHTTKQGRQGKLGSLWWPHFSCLARVSEAGRRQPLIPQASFRERGGDRERWLKR